jgi:hypothetical protein
MNSSGHDALRYWLESVGVKSNQLDRFMADDRSIRSFIQQLLANDWSSNLPMFFEGLEFEITYDTYVALVEDIAEQSFLGDSDTITQLFASSDIPEFRSHLQFLNNFRKAFYRLERTKLRKRAEEIEDQLTPTGHDLEAAFSRIDAAEMKSRLKAIEEGEYANSTRGVAKTRSAFLSPANRKWIIVLFSIGVIIITVIVTLLFRTFNDSSSSDRDYDGIMDVNDRCPDEAGAIESLGCPAAIDSIPVSSDLESPTSNGSGYESEQNRNVSKPDNNNPNQVSTSPQPSVNRAEVLTTPIEEPVNRVTIAEPDKEELIVKNVSAKLKTNSGANTISWNSELSKAKNLVLTISTASGLNFKKDVTGLSSYTFNPGSGEWQGIKCTVTLSSGDPIIAIDNPKLPNTFFNCSAE